MYKGQLEGFPQEIVEKMLEYQEKQGNKRDVSVFEKNDCSGFFWEESVEKYNFWHEVIEKRNFDLFFERYPKAESKTYPKIMMVSEDGENWTERNIVFECMVYATDEKPHPYYWRYAKEIEPKVTLTIEQIAEKFNLDPSQIKIDK